MVRFQTLSRVARRVYRRIVPESLQLKIGRYERKIEFDPQFYRSGNPELAAYSDSALFRHFIKFGQREGRLGSRRASKKEFIELVAAEESVLEIGPFTNPTITGENVKYFDLCDSVELSRRAAGVGYVQSVTPHIHYVSSEGDLSVVTEKFSCAFSSHCIEHQPDLIRHLNQVEDLLDRSGKYYLIAPDKRYCFDCAFSETALDEIEQAHKEKRARHSVQAIIEHRAYVSHNDPLRHWVGDHWDADYESKRERLIRAAEKELATANGAYIDVHAWRFTPCSLLHILESLYDLNYTSLKPIRVFNTRLGQLDFCVILEKQAG
ncbi:hypothetical protein [Methylocystis sp.]|uniref:hypothetical protein n=1 Tax=Methylocystis sp. TaxID=1911079 RepID=UPI003D0A57D6